MVVTDVFRTLAEFSVRHSNERPDHRTVVLSSDTNFEFATSEQLERAAHQSVVGVFGPPDDAT